MKNKMIKKLGVLGAILAIIGLDYGIYKLITIKMEYHQVDKTYEEILESCTDETMEAEIEEPEEVQEISISDDATFKIDWQKLQEINSDTIAWIKIDDTNVNYPILQGADNKEYIKTDFNGKKSKGGSIFVDSNISMPFDSSNTIIYGHNLNNGTMFNSLKKYSDEEYAKNHSEIQIFLPYQSVKIYKVFAFCKVNVNTTDFYNTSIGNLKDFYQEIEKHNQIHIVDDIDYTRPIIELSTCTNNAKSERYIVFAYLEQ